MTATPQEIVVRVAEGRAVVRPTGELDVSNAPQLRAAFERALAADVPVVVVDLCALTFIDSTALSAMVETWREATRRGIAFHLSGPAPNVRRVLEITQLDRLLVDE
jgi:anti-sigma B factor antagonist